MIYLYGYLAIGAVVFLTMYVSHKLGSKSGGEAFSDLLDDILPHRKTLSYRIIYHYVGPPIVAGIGLFVWPAIVYMKIQEMRKGESGAGYVEPVFSVGKDDLLAKQTIEQIESAEIISDPLGAAPALPFGHLHQCWLAFLAQMLPDDELWSFQSTWDVPWSEKEIRYGYVLVRAGIPDAYVLSEAMPFDSEDGD